jgi:hypothetical protein
MFSDGRNVIRRDPAAAHDGDPDRAIIDGGHRLHANSEDTGSR